MTSPDPGMRIGELAARTGVTTHLLRAWERRYGLLRPVRSSGGYRLYGTADLHRVREMQRLRGEGVAAGQAAAAALAGTRQEAPPARVEAAGTTSPESLRQELLAAVAEFSGESAHATLDAAFDRLGVEAAIVEVVLPALRLTGDRWASGEFSVAQEHFASNLVRGRLAALTLAWDSGTGPLAVLACPEGERHELGLLAFGVVLGRTGWRVRYLGAETPTAELAGTLTALHPDLVVLSAVTPAPLAAMVRALETLPDGLARTIREAPMVLTGAGATAELAAGLGAEALAGDPVEVARAVTQRARG